MRGYERASKEPARGLGPFQQEQGRTAEGLAGRCERVHCVSSLG